MAFRDDVVLTLVLVAALATGSTASTAATGVVTYEGGYDPVPAPTEGLTAQIEGGGGITIDSAVPRVRVRGHRVVVTAPGALFGVGLAELRVLTPSGRHWLTASVPREFLTSIGQGPPELVPAPQQPLTFPLRPRSLCHGIHARGDRRGWRATFSVPLRCLGDPPWVRGVSQAGRRGPRVPVPR